MIQNLIFSIGLSFAVGLSGVKDNHDNYINDIPNNVVYNDEEYKITLDGDELNYSYENLYNTNLLQNVTIVFDSLTFVFGENTGEGDYIYNDNEHAETLGFVIDADLYNSINSTDYADYRFYYYNGDEYIYPIDSNDFESGLTIISSSINYNAIKTAIELDIQANSAPSMSDFLTILNNIVSLLTGGLINMGSGLGNGLNSIVTSLAIENGGMSIFLAVIGIFGGIALAVGLTRRIFSWIESLGARR